MKKYNLNIVVSPDRCDINDFVTIVDNIKNKSDDINVELSRLYPADEEIPEIESEEVFNPDLPSLTVCLIDLPGFNPPGKLIMSKAINKIKQYEIFKDNNIDTPLTAMYDPNMDFSVFKGHVILKPYQSVLQSVKENIFVLPIEQVAKEKKIYEYPYIIQQFIDSGDYPSIYRAVVFLGEVLYKYKMSGTVKKLGDIIPVDFNNKNVSPEVDTRVWDHNQEVYDFAKQISEAFPDIPLLGVDIIEEANTKKLYAIEVNAGGNVWHFATHSRSIKLHPHLAEKRLNQYGAFNVAADALINKTRKLSV
jgi:hypothetical protein